MYDDFNMHMSTSSQISYKLKDTNWFKEAKYIT